VCVGRRYSEAQCRCLRVGERNAAATRVGMYRWLAARLNVTCGAFNMGHRGAWLAMAACLGLRVGQSVKAAKLAVAAHVWAMVSRGAKPTL
jgi:hypothetical protein